MIPYTENLKDNSKTTRTDQKFSKVAGYKINIQKLVAFLYTNNEILEKEYKNIVPFKVAAPKNQIPWNTPDQGGKGLICQEL